MGPLQLGQHRLELGKALKPTTLANAMALDHPFARARGQRHRGGEVSDDGDELFEYVAVDRPRTHRPRGGGRNFGRWVARMFVREAIVFFHGLLFFLDGGWTVGEGRKIAARASPSRIQ